MESMLTDDLNESLMVVREKLVNHIKDLEIQVEQAQTKLASFDDMFGIDTESETPRASIVGAHTSSKPVTKAPSKAKPHSETTTGPKAPKTRQVRQDGAKQSMPNLMISVMGTDSVNASQVFERLQQKGLLSQFNSNNPKGYISMIFSSKKDVFESVSRGTYRVKTQGASVDEGTTTPESADSPVEETESAHTPEEHTPAEASA